MINKWVITSAFWFAIILLTFYDVSKINQLHAALDEIETLRLDQQFWQRHSEDLDGLVAESKRLYLTVDSVDMGLLTVEYRLKTLSSQLGLPPVTLTKQQGNQSESEVPVGISFAGSFGNMFKLLQSIKKDMPFLKAKNIKINVDPFTRKIVLEASFFLKYKTEPSIDEPKTSGGT